MPPKNAHAVALIRGIYKVSAATNSLIHKDDDYLGRLTDRDWAICLGQGEYMTLKVSGSRIKGLRYYRFHASPVGRPLRWVPSEDEMMKLMLGQTITAPMDLDSLPTIEALTPPPTTRLRAMLADGGGQDA